MGQQHKIWLKSTR